MLTTPTLRRLKHGLLRTLSGALILSGSAFAHADGISTLKKFLNDTHTVSSHFSQTVVGKKKTQRSEGSFELQRPGKFRWEYTRPFPQLIVSDAARIWVYDVDLAQVTERKLGEALGDTPAALLAGSNALETGFKLTADAPENGLEWVTALPRSDKNSYQSIRLGLAEGQLRRMVLKDLFGQTTTIDFSAIQTNTAIDPKRFVFVAPAGTDIIAE